MPPTLLAISACILLTIGVEASYFGIDYDAKAAYFNFQNDGVDEYVFALNAVENGDIYFHMSGPVAHCWIGVGIGNEMKDSFMLIAYPSADGLRTTISPRIATGHSEPLYDPSKQIVHIHNDTYAPNANLVTDDGTGTIIAHSVCLNCTKWATGFLDTTRTSQPFIFALGPNVTFRSDDPGASIPRHSLVGKFTMDMVKATNSSGWYGRVPAPNIPGFVFPPNDTAFASSNSEPAFDVVVMSNPMPGIHAALMCIAFVLVFPAGALVMRFLKRTLWHAAIQIVGFCLTFAGFGIAASFARQYNKSKNFDSAHQVIGLIILAALVMQLGLGLVHHSVYARSKKPTPFGRIHFLLGPFIIILGLINGGIGVGFARNHALKIPYAVVVGLLFGFLLVASGLFLFLRSRRRYKPESRSQPDHSFAKQDDREMEIRETSFGEMSPPEPYELPIPYSPTVPAPYSPTVPFTPTTTYTPVTPSMWKNGGVDRWPDAPYREFG